MWCRSGVYSVAKPLTALMRLSCALTSAAICDTHNLMVSSRSLLSREKASRLPVYACDVLSKAHLHPFSSTH
jgi:hypothetical protein